MPELPEVETVRRGLDAIITGATITSVQTLRPDLRFPLPPRFAERLCGQRVVRLQRRAKYLVAVLSGGEALVMHLGMTGRFTIEHSLNRTTARTTFGDYVYDTGADAKHDHVVMCFQGPHLPGGARVIYNDPRRFGFMLLLPEAERSNHALFKNLGAEPLSAELTPDYLAARASGRKVSLKAFLMDQRNIAGLGNIYVSEALHRARLSPNRGARSLSDAGARPTDRTRRLVPAIVSVLEDAIAAGGSTLNDYRQADGREGSFQKVFAVYDREGGHCLRPGCGGRITRSVHGGRATYACRSCQR